MRHSSKTIIFSLLFFLTACGVDQILPGSNNADSSPTPISTPSEPTPLAANPQPGAEGIGDPFFPLMGNGGYDVTHYLLDLTVDLDENHISGVVTLTMTATQDLSQFNLELHGMTIEKIIVDGFNAEFERDDLELTIIPAGPISVGETFITAVFYNGEPIDPMDELGVEGWYNYGDGIYVAGEPTGSSNWYPVNEHPLDKASYTFMITVDESLTVAANGSLIEVIEKDNSHTYHFEAPDPMASYLVTVGIGNFEVSQETTPSGVIVRNYFGEGLSQAVKNDFSQQADMIEFFNTIFGLYPFDEYGAIVHNIELHFALETQTLSIFGNSFTYEYVISHELAHQWFGDSVSLSEWQDIWLNEGFATYASLLWTEHLYGTTVLEEVLTDFYIDMAPGGEFTDDPEDSLPPPALPNADNLFSSSIYLRGALALHALRLEVGDDAFFEILMTFTEKFKNSNATIQDFIDVSEEISGQELEALFQTWLYEENIPDMPELDLYREDYLTDN